MFLDCDEKDLVGMADYDLIKLCTVVLLFIFRIEQRPYVQHYKKSDDSRSVLLVGLSRSRFWKSLSSTKTSNVWWMEFSCATVPSLQEFFQ